MKPHAYHNSPIEQVKRDDRYLVVPFGICIAIYKEMFYDEIFRKDSILVRS